jgi:hypothetical protein
MTATLHLNLSNTLNADELRALTEIALERQVPLERVLFEAAREAAGRRQPQPPTPTMSGPTLAAA